MSRKKSVVQWLVGIIGFFAAMFLLVYLTGLLFPGRGLVQSDVIAGEVTDVYSPPQGLEPSSGLFSGETVTVGIPVLVVHVMTDDGLYILEFDEEGEDYVEGLRENQSINVLASLVKPGTQVRFPRYLDTTSWQGDDVDLCSPERICLLDSRILQVLD